MKSEQFERMTRSMAAAGTRRGLLRAFAGGVAAAAFARLLSPSVAHAVQLCSVDQDCPEDQRCAVGVCVAGLVASPAPGPQPPNMSECCGRCSRKLDGCFIACYQAPNRESCWSGCTSRFNVCRAACPSTCP